jgi:hypothetical protein
MCRVLGSLAKPKMLRELSTNLALQILIRKKTQTLECAGSLCTNIQFVLWDDVAVRVHVGNLFFG